MKNKKLIIIISAIVYLSAFSFLFKLKLGKIFMGRNNKNVNDEKPEEKPKEVQK